MTIGENVEITSKGVSQIVIKVRNKLSVGKNSVIRVRNGYYPNAPANSISTITADNLNTKGIPVEDFYLYENSFGKGGYGGDGGSGDDGRPQLYPSGYYVCGGGGGGGGGGGYGGGVAGDGGYGGAAAQFIYCEVSGNDAFNGHPGFNNGGYGGDGAADLGSGGCGGVATDIGKAGGNLHLLFSSGGGGGGGNGGKGGAANISVSYFNGSSGYGGGGGYGGGVLTIIADSIIAADDSPHFLVSGQKGGLGGYMNGAKGEGCLLIIQANNYISSPLHWNLDQNILQTVFKCVFMLDFVLVIVLYVSIAPRRLTMTMHLKFTPESHRDFQRREV